MRCRPPLLILPISLTLALSLPASADPLDPSAGVLEASYRSAFDGYQNDQDAEVGGWPEANERVGEIGGWRAYLRQAQEPVPESGEANQEGPDQSPTNGVKR